MSKKLRDTQLDALRREDLDVLIVGGGINGVVSAAALASRGCRVGLIDARDFAGFSSQHSSNLVWGGIKYMEGYEFGLVAELCRARNDLLDSFPSTVKEIRFLMTLNRNFRFHPLVILMSTWFYWLLGRARTRVPRFLRRRRIQFEEPLINSTLASAGIVYSDAFLHDNDARFVFNFVRDAMKKGCRAANYVRSLGSRRDDDGAWTTSVVDTVTGARFEVRSRVVVNATGAFADDYNRLSGIETRFCHLLSKGVHLIVPRISAHHRVLAFFADDERLFFAIPMANRTCVGTTDTLVDDAATTVTDEDREFILSNINARLDLELPLTRDDIIAERCGVRPLAIKADDRRRGHHERLSRKHVIEADFEASYVSVFGGKMTDCLNVGEEVADLVRRLGVALPIRLKRKWYGEPGAVVREEFLARANELGLDSMVAADTGESLSERLWRRYGEDAHPMLDRIAVDRSLAEPLIENLGVCGVEMEHLANEEMIVRLEDYLRRRSKIELLVPQAELRRSAGLAAASRYLFGDAAQEQLDEYFDSRNRCA